MCPRPRYGEVEMTLPDKPQSRSQSYRLSKLGLRYQAKSKAKGRLT